MKTIKLITVMTLCATLFASCAVEEPAATVPVSEVNLYINLDALDYDLNGALSYKIFTEKDRRRPQDRFGFGGVLVVRDAAQVGIYAYDLACPHEDNPKIVVTPTTDGKALCPTCHSVFATMFGTGHCESGPSTEPLQRYRVRVAGNNAFTVTNW